MSESRQPLGRIVTFYSYKGGTGRSMAVANVAWILASNGYKVLAIDWDLEAPGLHRYFRPFLSDPALTASPGLIEFFIEFADAAFTTTQEQSADDWFRDYADLRMFATGLDWPHFSGCLDFVGAGRQDTGYSTRINSFNWQHFYTKLGGGVFLEETKRQLRAEYDYILIDSRTGVSDTSGICTVQMPDRLVVCFTLNEQSIAGAASTAASAAAQRTPPAAETTLRIMPVATRVDQGEKERADGARQDARNRFAGLLEWLDDDQVAEYWAEVETPYLPFYAFEEVLAAFGDPPGQRTSMLASMEGLTSWISDKDVQGLPPIDESLRTQTLARFMRPRPKPRAADPAGDRYLAYVSYADRDPDGLVRRFIQDLSHEIAALSGAPLDTIAFYDRARMRAGDDWSEKTEDAFRRSGMLLVLDSPTLRRSQSAGAAQRGFEEAGKAIYTVSWIPVDETGMAAEMQRSSSQTMSSSDGLRALLRIKQNSDSYAIELERIARDLIALARPRSRPRKEFPPEILIAVLAERRGGTISRFATGTYGMRRREWVPFSRNPQSIAAMVGKARTDSLPFKLISLHKFETWLQSTPRRSNQGAILIIDPASVSSRDAPRWLSAWRHAPRAPFAMIHCVDAGGLQREMNEIRDAVSKLVAHEHVISETVFDESSFVLALRKFAQQLPQVAATLAAERTAWHPADDLDRRSELTPCVLSIPGDWRRRSSKRWLEWGDVLVELIDPPNQDLTYLLPSGRAPEALRTPKSLRDEGGLSRKQALTERFLAEFAGRQLEGYWFYRRMSDEIRRVQVYCPQYDEFLNLDP